MALREKTGSRDVNETIETQARLAIDTARGPKGRKDKSGQEKVINMKALENAMEELERSYKRSGNAAEAFSDMVKKIAEKSGLMASVVKRVVKARVDDTFADKQREHEQMSLVFEAIGED